MTKFTTTKPTTTVTTTTTTTTDVVKKPLTIYTPPTLTPLADWTMPTDDYSVSQLLMKILKYRREYESEGIALFCEDFLRPTLNAIIGDLQQRGYTVATSAYGSKVSGYTNYAIDVSKGDTVGDTLFVAHYDTVDRDVPFTTRKWNSATKKYEETVSGTMPQRHYKWLKVDNNVVSLDLLHEENTDVGCLGADDGAGLAVMLHLLHSGVVGGYCFTTGEECGGIGAREVLKSGTAFLSQYKKSVEIDRRNSNEVIWSQGVGDCASEEFTQWLCDSLKMEHKPSDKGSYTDVATFAQVIAENVNIGAGYINAHSPNEQVDLAYLENLATALKAVDWAVAPVKRTPNDFGTKYTYWGKSKGYYVDGWDDSDYYWGSTTKTTPAQTEQDDDLMEDVYIELVAEMDNLCKVGMVDPDFMMYCLSYGVNSLADLDALAQEWYGQSWDKVAEQYKDM